MATTIGMCNAALRKIGVNRIDSLDEDVPAAEICNERFQDVLDALTMMHPWNDAIARADLTQDSTDPAFGYTYRYLLPAGGAEPYCLRVLSEKNDYEFVIEGRYLLTDYSEISIVYVKRITDVSTLSPAFREAFADYLAADLAANLNGDLQQQQLMLARFERSFSLAKLVDSQQGTRPTMPDGSWLTNRI